MTAMEDSEVIDISVPKGWTDMTQEQLSYFFFMLNSVDSMESVITRCFLKWGGVKVVGRNSGTDFILRKGKSLFSISPVDLWQLMSPLWWLYDIPKTPAVVLKFGRHHAVDPLFKGVPLGTYLSCVAVWSDMMKAGHPDDGRIRELISLLYGFRPKTVPNILLGCVIYWMTSLQEYFSRKFPDLFSQASSDGQGSLGSASSSFQDSMNAMIRALTKGDVLKEKEVLDCDTWRAIVELNAQAKESRIINEKINSK